MAHPSPQVGFPEIEAARQRLQGRVHRTPLLHSTLLDQRLGTELWLKAESLQRSGSFKIRGALNAALVGLEAGDHRGLVALSSGNHGQALALAARELGLPATIVMPENSSPVKIAAVRAYGATVICEGITVANREERTAELAARQNLRLIHPHDDAEVIAGQGTVGLEIAEQSEAEGGQPDLLVVPVGGGGLISGVALAGGRLMPKTKVIGVEPAAGDDGAQSLRSGRLVTLEAAPQTAADGARTLQLGKLPWEIIQSEVSEIVTVSDEALAEACWWLWTRTKLVVEPTGALALAALLTGAVPGGGEASRVVCILSGGNCEPGQLAALVATR